MEDTKNNGFKYSGNLANTLVTQKRYSDEDPSEARIKNLKGDLGPICNYCAGLGFTNTIGGQSLSCRICNGSGIEPVDSRVLQDQIDDLKLMVEQILKKLTL